MWFSTFLLLSKTQEIKKRMMKDVTKIEKVTKLLFLIKIDIIVVKERKKRNAKSY